LELKPVEPGMVRPQENTVDNSIWIWKATENHEFVFRFSIGFRYSIPII